MTERFKATVRRRDEGDGEDWPPCLRWVADWDRFDAETDRFISGCAVPFETHAEALAEAIAEADEVRRRNAAEEATNRENGSAR